MSEYLLQLKIGNSDTMLRIKGDTDEEAKEIAQAIAALWKSATDTEKKNLVSLVESGNALDYIFLNEDEFRDLYKKMNGTNLFVRKDVKDKYHVIKQREDKKHSQEALAVRMLRKKQIANVMDKQRKGKKQLDTKDEKPSDDEQRISGMLFWLRRELAPVIERIENLELELKKMKEDK